MATDVNNDELNQYNDSLRDSLNLSKMLSDNVVALAGSMAKVSMEGRSTLSGLKEIGKDIQKTIALTDKLRAGKLKEKEVNFQIAKLQETYIRYQAETASGANNILSMYQRSLEIQRDIATNDNKKLQLERELSSETALNISLNQQLVTKLQEVANASQQYKQGLKDEAAILKQEISSSNSVLNSKEKQINQTDKLIAKSQKEADQVENILYSHEQLLHIYQQELTEANQLKDELNKQTRYSEKIKEEWKGVVKNAAEGLLKFTSINFVFGQLKAIAFAISGQIKTFQHELVLSEEAAKAVRQEFQDMADTSGDTFITTKKLIEANSSLGKQLGFNTKFGRDMNTEFINLTKRLGISEEAAGGLAKLTKASGQSFKDVKNTVYQTTQALSSQNGIQINQKEVMEEVGKITGQTLAMLKGNPKALTEAVVQAKLLGTTLESAKKSGAALLDFESSIENELQAELITGKQFNLERARSAALTGDLTTEMKELANQGIDFNSYSNMNVIAQQKIADMMGKTSDELTDQLLKQQYLGKSREQIIAMGGQEIADRVEALDAQDKFNSAVEKMQDLVGSLVGGPLGDFVMMMADIASNAYVLYGTLGLIGAVSLVKAFTGIAALATELTAAAVAAGALDALISPGQLVVGLAAAAGAAAIIGGLVHNASQEPKPFANGGIVSGPTNALVGEYAGAQNNPEVIAPLSDLQNMIQPQQQIAVAQDNSAVVNAIIKLGDTMSGVKDGVNQLYNKKTNIYMGPNKIATSLTLSNYNLS
jgi:hypothetical protein